MRTLFSTSVRKPVWQRFAVLLLCGLVLGLTFMAYFAPDLMVALTNTVWALCGFQIQPIESHYSP
jgi:uncharacterized membrane protein YoaK (UPF0700 family)